MFIREAAQYVNLTIPQFRKYIAEEKIKYKKSGIENYYNYDNDDIEKLKYYLNIVKQYQNYDFDIHINDDVYQTYKDEIDQEYIHNIVKVRNKFSLDEYKKYKSMLDKKRGLQIKYICNSCNQENYMNIMKIKNLNIKYLVCNKCKLNEKKQETLRKKELEKNLKKQQKVKEKKQDNIGTENNPILWKDYDVNNYHSGSTKLVKIICSECHEDSLIRICNFEKRKYGKGLPICSKCIMKYVTNCSEWKKVNSEAQLIAQNRPEVKEKMKKIIIDKIKNDCEFRRKITRFSSTLCGYYNNIKFDSSWELSVLHYYEGNIRPCEITIPYTLNGKQRLYLPDFDLYLNNKKYLLEIKGRYQEADYVKIETAQNAIKNGLNDYDDMIIIDKRNIKALKGIILFDSIEKLKMLDPKKLTILKYPKSWNM